jgi:hypothetical protein
MRDRPGDPVLAEEQDVPPATEGAGSGGRGYPAWCAEQVVKLSRWGGSRTPWYPAGSELLSAVLRYWRYGPGRHPQPTLAAGCSGPAGWCYGRVVLRPGQLVGQDFSLMVIGVALAVAAVFQLACRRIQPVVDRRFNQRPVTPARRPAHGLK